MKHGFEPRKILCCTYWYWNPDRMSTISKGVFSAGVKEKILQFRASLVEQPMSARTERRTGVVLRVFCFNYMILNDFTGVNMPLPLRGLIIGQQHIVVHPLYFRVNNARNEFRRKIVG